MSCGVGRSHGWDLALLWLWCKPAAVAPIQPLAWELPYAVGVALKRKKKEKNIYGLKYHCVLASRLGGWVSGVKLLSLTLSSITYKLCDLRQDCDNTQILSLIQPDCYLATKHPECTLSRPCRGRMRSHIHFFMK